jgi:hypothetical protein
MKQVLEEELGYPVLLIPDTSDIFKADDSIISALARGAAHIYPEVCPPHPPACECRQAPFG